MNIGIIGHEERKFTAKGEAAARSLIRNILSEAMLARVFADALRHPNPHPVAVSGHCHLGGVDIWTEEEADKLGVDKLIFPPAVFNWEHGYKPRNIQIAQNSSVVHVIVVREYPRNYEGMYFKLCYHCARPPLLKQLSSDSIIPTGTNHIKSGACWSAHYAMKLGKIAHWHIIDN